MSDVPRDRRLPLVPGGEHLTFRCNGCGDCCRSLRIALTHHDLRRLAAGLGRSPASFVEWLAPDAVDMTGEPGSFVELRVGRRLMVLAQRGGACHLLGAEQRCDAYALRPMDCRLYPLDLARGEGGALLGVERLDPHGCGERGEPADVAALAASDQRRWRELEEYQGQVARWNRLARHRRRFGRQPGEAADFLSFLGLDAPESAGARASDGTRLV